MTTELVRVPVEVAATAVVFGVAARGYDRRQVDAHVAALEQELAELRWEHDELAAQRRALAEQRAEQARWVPSFDALGSRVVEVLRLAEQEAAALTADALRTVRRAERTATADIVALRQEHEAALAAARRDGERELRALEVAVQGRRELLDAELAHVRRDAELEVAGRLAQATARAQDTLAEAAREAEAQRAAARAEVARLQRRRDELAAELTDVSARLLAVVHRLGRDAPPPLDVRTT